MAIDAIGYSPHGKEQCRNGAGAGGGEGAPRRARWTICGRRERQLSPPLLTLNGPRERYHGGGSLA
jgi:hypothetical protein